MAHERRSCSSPANLARRQLHSFGVSGAALAIRGKPVAYDYGPLSMNYGLLSEFWTSFRGQWPVVLGYLVSRAVFWVTVVGAMQTTQIQGLDLAVAAADGTNPA